MKNVKTLLIFIIISACMFASAQRVESLGGNVGYWSDDDNSWTAFPHTINKSNLAQVSGLGVDGGHNAIVRWGEGTKWGFTWDQASENDMVNLQWGNGTYGATFGLAMAASDNGTTSTSSTGISASFGMEQDFGEIGVGFSNSSMDDGSDATTDDPSAMGLSVNVRRDQSIWLFDKMLIGFIYSSDNEISDDDGPTGVGQKDATTNMTLSTSSYTHLNISENTTALVAMGFKYNAIANGDASATTIAFPTWTFGVESAMTDWATVRMGVNAGYVLSATANSGVANAKDVTGRGGMDTGFSVGIGFNYGSFNLDMSVSENLFTNPVAHITGFEDLNDENATATLTYVW